MRSAWASVLLLAACASTDVAEPATPVTSTSASTSARADGTVAGTSVAPATVTATGGERTDRGDDGAIDVDAAPSTVPSDEAVLPEGFATTLAVVTEPDGTICELCLWLADTSRQRSRGLMFVTDLGPADGMAFRYPGPHTGTFWMKDTVLPLSIAFVDTEGAYIDAFDMEPCTSAPCPNYATPEGFLVAVEVPRGRLDDVGLVPGSRLELLDVPCDG